MNGFPIAPPGGGDARMTASILASLRDGKLNSTGNVTLAANQDSTDWHDHRVAAGSFIALAPLSASAAAESAGGGLFVSARNNGRFTISHSNSALTDRHFSYLIIGG